VVGVDTNLIVRLLTRDDEPQFQRAEKVFQQEQVFIADAVLLETEWVLRYAYGFGCKEIGQAFDRLLGLANVHVRDVDTLHRVLELHRQGLDFADAMHLETSPACSAFLSFDRSFVRRAQGKTERPVRIP
jgi:predicted nucleic-acid-binding protein